MKKHYLLSALLASFLLFISFHGVYAQTASISGDELCGATADTACNFTHVKTIFQKVLYAFVIIGGSALVLFISIRLVQAWYAYRSGNAGAIKQAGENIFQGIIGFFIVFSVLGGIRAAGLSYLGTKPEFLKFLELISEAFVPHAYAVEEGLLPNPLGSNSLLDLILAGMNLAMRFFVYPALLIMWVWSGFQFVFSRGNPEGLKKARSWLLWAFLVTVISFMLQGFLLALKATALKIAPQNAAVIQPGK